MRRRLKTLVLLASTTAALLGIASPDARALNCPEEQECYHDAYVGADSLGTWIPQFETALGSRYGATWINRDVTPNVLTVGVVGRTSWDETTVDTITGAAATTAAVAVPYSAADLQAWVEVVSDRTPPDRFQGVNEDVDLGTLTILTDVELDAATKSSIETGIPPGVVQYISGAAAVSPAHAVAGR